MAPPSHKAPRRPGRSGWLALVLLLVAGCASFQANRADVAQRVQGMVDAHEYSRALATIDLVKPGHPDHARLSAWRGSIAKRAQEWEAALLDETENLVRAGRWFDAEQRLEEGLQRMPDSRPLQAGKARFLARRREHLEALELDLMLARGRGLPAEIAALEEIAEITPRDETLALDIATRRRQLEQARERLVDCGKKSLEVGLSKRAVECLDLAEKIRTGDDTGVLLATLRQSQNVKQRRDIAAAQKREERDQERRIELLVEAYRGALARGELNAARRHLDELLRAQPRETWKQESARLDRRIEQRVSKGLEDGRQLYTQGDVKGARATWAAALRLDPANEELKSSIARADRVLKKLEQLSSDQQTKTN